MSFKDEDFKIEGSYDSTENDVINSFYVPVLSKAYNYDRIAGFFSSSSLAVSSKGLLSIADKGGKIRFLVSPRLSQADVNLMNDAATNPEKYLSDLMCSELDSENNEIAISYRNLLGHLIAKGAVEIKVVLVKKDNRYMTAEEIDESSIFHIKVGVLYDEDNNIISFSGSINETFTAWNDNIEEFKTFKSWDPGQAEYCLKDKKKFDDFWCGARAKTVVMDLPKAVEQDYINYSKLTDYEGIKEKINKLEKNTKKKMFSDLLFWYQKEAFEKWKNNNYKMLFAMATGTGKTITALACIEHLLKNNKLVAIIATPQSALSLQWQSEAEKIGLEFDRCLVCDSNHYSYKTKLEEYVYNLNLNIDKSLIIYTTHDTACSENFIKTIKRINTDDTRILFVGDEVHGVGSKEHRKALLYQYEYRIGLSATPNRWFDDEGSDILKEYFGNCFYEFGIDKAIIEKNPITGQSFLTPYNYYPWFAYLNDDENIKYDDITNKIKKLSFADDEDEQIKQRKERLLEERADIIKEADDKLSVIRDLISYLKNKSENDGKKLSNTLIFTSPKHLPEVMRILNEYNIVASPLTEKQKNDPLEKYRGKTERQNIIDEFKKEHIQVIVAIKCMDEGIDIPQADTAILMSSTTNPREYIQRIGRVIRRYPGKTEANIYDLVTKSNREEVDSCIKKNELKRARYIIENSKNGLEAINKIF